MKQTQSYRRIVPTKTKSWPLCWHDIGPPSTPLIQHHANTGWTCVPWSWIYSPVCPLSKLYPHQKNIGLTYLVLWDEIIDGNNDPMPVSCWSTVCDAGPTWNRHWVSVQCGLGGHQEDNIIMDMMSISDKPLRQLVQFTHILLTVLSSPSLLAADGSVMSSWQNKRGSWSPLSLLGSGAHAALHSPMYPGAHTDSYS